MALEVCPVDPISSDSTRNRHHKWPYTCDSAIDSIDSSRVPFGVALLARTLQSRGHHSMMHSHLL